MNIKLNQIIFIGIIALIIIAAIVFGYIDYRNKQKANVSEEINQEESEKENGENQKKTNREEEIPEELTKPQEYQDPGSDIVIYDIDDKTGSLASALIAWRTSKRTTNDFIEYSLSRGNYTSKLFSENTDSGLYHLVNLIDLKSDAIYYYRITSTDLEGNKTTTMDRAFKTIYRDYNFIGSLDFVTVKEPNQTWLISKNRTKRTVSLGSYKLSLEKNTFLRIPKIWIIFSSQALSNRDDKIYGLEDSYLSKIFIRKDEEVKEIKLSKAVEHMFLELADYPLGNIVPLNYESDFEFEILVELNCNNFQNGECLDNQGKSLDYINKADIQAQIRVFGISAQEISKDILVNAQFKYK